MSHSMLKRLVRSLCAAPLLIACAALAGQPPELIALVKRGDREAALPLIKRGKVDAREPDGTSALHYAVYNGDVELVKRLIRARADVNARNDYGATPLAVAAESGNAAIIELLLKAGADVESPNAEGQTALMVVARTGNVEAARLLLRQGADVNAREGWSEQTALMWATARRHPDMVKLLIEHGADVNARAAVRNWQRRVTSEPRPKTMNRGGLTPLLYAARESCIECARHLLEGGADIDLPDPDRTTPLVLALMNLNFDFAAFLIEQGADVDKWDLYGQTPLYVAIDMNTLPAGGRPDIPSEDDTTALQVAEMLLERGANPNIQLKLRPPYRNIYFDRGGDQVLSTGATPLLRAAKGGDVAAVKLLLKYNALVDLPTATGVTPLMAAAGMGHSSNPTRGRYKTDAQAAECLRLLYAAGGRINARAANGQMALHSAAAKGWNETVEVLAANGAELEAVDDKGLTPYDHAAGRYERAFLEPEPEPKPETMKLLEKLIVAATGRPPKEFHGTYAKQQLGTAGAVGR